MARHHSLLASLSHPFCFLTTFLPNSTFSAPNYYLYRFNLTRGTLHLPLKDPVISLQIRALKLIILGQPDEAVMVVQSSADFEIRHSIILIIFNPSEQSIFSILPINFSSRNKSIKHFSKYFSRSLYFRNSLLFHPFFPTFILSNQLSKANYK